MSDFDKEAEREKLREKYENDEEKRETTEQMSELLLKGATMTNAHCSDCGDPIFRYDGQEFCPTCQKAVDRGTGEQAEESVDESAAEPGQNGAASEDQIEVTSPSDEANVRFGGQEPPAEESPSETDAKAESPARSSGNQTPEPTGGQNPEPAGAQNQEPVANTSEAEARQQIPSAAPSKPTTRDQQQANTAQQSTGQRTGGSVSEHLGQAQVTLAQTVERYARQAAEADSPREAREHLETAREAAETLAATEF